MVSAHATRAALVAPSRYWVRTSLAENGIQLTQSSVSSESCWAAAVFIPAATAGASRSGQHGGFTEESDELLPTPAAPNPLVSGNRAVDIRLNARGSVIIPVLFHALTSAGHGIITILLYRNRKLVSDD